MDFSKAVKTNPEPTVYPPLWNGPAQVEISEPDLVDDGKHPLLIEESPAYSASVIQRAFITWSHLGKSNGFRQTCDYYHRLEKLEETFTEQARLESRRLEFSIISKPPPVTSEFLATYGYIYGHQHSQGLSDKKDIWGCNDLSAQFLTNGTVNCTTTYAGYNGTVCHTTANRASDSNTTATHVSYNGLVGQKIPNGAAISKAAQATHTVYNGIGGHDMPNVVTDSKITVKHGGYNGIVGHIAPAQVAYPVQSNLAWLHLPKGSKS